MLHILRAFWGHWRRRLTGKFEKMTLQDGVCRNRRQRVVTVETQDADADARAYCYRWPASRSRWWTASSDWPCHPSARPAGACTSSPSPRTDFSRCPRPRSRPDPTWATTRTCPCRWSATSRRRPRRWPSTPRTAPSSSARSPRRPWPPGCPDPRNTGEYGPHVPARLLSTTRRNRFCIDRRLNYERIRDGNRIGGRTIWLRDANDSESKLFWKLEKRPEIIVEPSDALVGKYVCRRRACSSPRQLLGPGPLSWREHQHRSLLAAQNCKGVSAYADARSQNYYRVNPLCTIFHTPRDNRDVSLNYIISVGSQPVFHVIRR